MSRRQVRAPRTRRPRGHRSAGPGPPGNGRSQAHEGRRPCPWRPRPHLLQQFDAPSRRVRERAPLLGRELGGQRPLHADGPYVGIGEDGAALLGDAPSHTISRGRLSRDGDTARLERQVTDPTPHVPTTLVRDRGRLLLVRSRFDKGGPRGWAPQGHRSPWRRYAAAERRPLASRCAGAGPRRLPPRGHELDGRAAARGGGHGGIRVRGPPGRPGGRRHPGSQAASGRRASPATPRTTPVRLSSAFGSEPAPTSTFGQEGRGLRHPGTAGRRIPRRMRGSTPNPPASDCPDSPADGRISSLRPFSGWASTSRPTATGKGMIRSAQSPPSFMLAIGMRGLQTFPPGKAEIHATGRHTGLRTLADPQKPVL